MRPAIDLRVDGIIRGGGILRSDTTTGNVVNTIIDLNDALAGAGVGYYVGHTKALMVFTNCSLQALTDVQNTYSQTNGPCLFETDNRFVNTNAGNFRLSGASPCINAGIHQDWMATAVDLDDYPRIHAAHGNLVDMGAYEYRPQGTVLMMR